jgi:hypothetical protein
MMHDDDNMHRARDSGAVGGKGPLVDTQGRARHLEQQWLHRTKAPRRWAHGLVEERGQYLYVTSGIGTSGLPLRWGVPPEIVVLDTAGKQRT